MSRMKKSGRYFYRKESARADANIRHMAAWRELPKADSLGRQDAVESIIFGRRRRQAKAAA